MNKAATSTLIGAAAVALAVGLAVSLHGQADNDEKSQPSDKKQTVAGVKADRETQQRLGLELQPLKPATAYPEITLFGTLEADPAQEFALRSPIAGTLLANGNWPMLGAQVTAASIIGTVKPQLMPMDQLTLSERLASARFDVTAAKASAAAADAEAGRLRQLNAEDKNVSDKAVQEAESNAAAADARLRSAESSAELIAVALQPGSNAGAVPLRLLNGGEVIEVAAQPGETVEPGQLLVRVSRFQSLLARVYVPPGQSLSPAAHRARISLADREDAIFPAERVAVAGSIDPKLQGQTLLFRLAAGRATLRPGQAVTARIAEPGESARGVLIPAGAILRFQGAAWVYVQSAPDLFARRIVPLDRPSPGGWLVSSGFSSGQRVVTSGAQLLLSEEMKSQLETDEQ